MFLDLTNFVDCVIFISDHLLVNTSLLIITASFYCLLYIVILCNFWHGYYFFNDVYNIKKKQKIVINESTFNKFHEKIDFFVFYFKEQFLNSGFRNPSICYGYAFSQLKELHPT